MRKLQISTPINILLKFTEVGYPLTTKIWNLISRLKNQVCVLTHKLMDELHEHINNPHSFIHSYIINEMKV